MKVLILNSINETSYHRLRRMPLSSRKIIEAKQINKTKQKIKG